MGTLPRAALLATLLLSTTAIAAEGDDVAVAAAQVHEELCANAAGDDVNLLGGSIARVGQAYEDVNAAFSATSVPSLLYWRGLLALCLGREELATDDLNGFLEQVGDDPALAGQIQDAETRVRRLQKPAAAPPPDPGGVALGVGLAGLAAALGGGSGAQYAELQQLEGDVRSGSLTTAELDAAFEGNGDEMAARTNVFIAAAAGSAAGSLVSFLVTGATRGAPRVAAAAIPTDGGVVFSIGGRW